MNSRQVTEKPALRRDLSGARNAMAAEARDDMNRALLDHAVTNPMLTTARVVTAYASMGTEPSTTALIEQLTAQGTRVLLPVLAADYDLDWAEYTNYGDLAPGRQGLLEPSGPRLGRAAIAEADLVLTPGLAVDRSGNRMGRGGGCYDRALARVKDAPTVVLLYPSEVGITVPVEAHDQPVTAALSAHGWTWFTTDS